MVLKIMENVARWQLCSVDRGTGSVSLLRLVAGDVKYQLRAVRSKVTVPQCSNGSSMTDYLGRKYRMVSEDKFDDYMKALGVNIILRKVGTTVMSDFLLTEKDGVYSMAITSTFRSQYLDFRPGVETLTVDDIVATTVSKFVERV
ncbi:hypothetical protein B566_EDAN009946 [Ephemera danica]|nr:hypothetical protein B566_EDAN009946 [Ephemera danica]